jgi:hypothetical protein
MTRKNCRPTQRCCCIFGAVFAMYMLYFLAIRPDIGTPTYMNNYSVLYNYRDSVLSLINSALKQSQYHQTERKCSAKLLRMY